MRPYLLLACTLSVAACVPGPPPSPSQYHTAATTKQVPLVFVPGTSDLPPPQIAKLHQLGQTLPVQATPILESADPLGAARVQAVERQLARPVAFASVPAMPLDQALLIITEPSIVATACGGPGVRALGSIWPSNDDDAPILLPPGCATALDIEAQTIQPPDLLQGRPLPPAAATPFAAAIERYYHRNDQPQQSTATQGASQGASDQSVSTTSSAAAAASPLLGPLPSGGQTTQ